MKGVIKRIQLTATQYNFYQNFTHAVGRSRQLPKLHYIADNSNRQFVVVP